MKRKADRVRGANNPGFGHGGKFSPFSKKFVAYAGLDEASKSEAVEKTYDKMKETKRLHPERDNTQPEYYMARGMDRDQAIQALSERQSTFSLEKCITEYGVEIGTARWRLRQNTWQDSLSELSSEVKKEINRKRAEVSSPTKVSAESAIFFDDMIRVLNDFGYDIVADDIITGHITNREFTLERGDVNHVAYDFLFRKYKLIVEYHNIAWHPHPDHSTWDCWQHPLHKRYPHLTRDVCYHMDLLKQEIAETNGYTFLSYYKQLERSENFLDRLKNTIEQIISNDGT